MRSLTIKHEGLRFFTLSVIICLGWATAMAENGDEPSEKTRVSADLEQRMLKTISVEFRNTPIDDVIRIMADQADVDIVKSPNVIGEVTVTLTDVPLEEVLNNILSVHGYAYTLTENMIRIVTAEEKVAKPEPLKTETYEIVYADITAVVKALEKFKSSKGSVSSIQGTSYVIVTDTESKIRDMTALIDKIDQITPQILVEARIYDVTSKDRLDLGIEWDAGRNTAYPLGQPDITTRTDPFITGGFNGTTAQTEVTTGALRFGWLNPSIDTDFLIKAQKENVDAKLLANPRILVLDNETASIKIISEIPYQELQESSSGGSVGTTAFREVGVELTVTPHLATRDDMVRLHLRPVFSVVTGSVQVAGVSGVNPQPVVDKREADTTLLIKHGQTVVLGGLRKKEATKQINKIPVLGDLPLIGILFRFEGEETVVSELIVFITPYIVRQPVMSQDESRAYQITGFGPPDPVPTRAEISEKVQPSEPPEPNEVPGGSK